MRRRVLISIFCVVAFLAVAVLLCAFLFAVREIRVEFGAVDAAQMTRYEDGIRKEADYIRNKNILFLSEGNLSDRIQSQLEDIEVTDVVRQFPNVVTIRVNVRYPHAYVELKENGAVTGYAIVDNTLRVRSVVTTQPSGLIRLNCDGLDVSAARVGKILTAAPAAFAEIAADTFAAFARIGYGTFDCVALIDEISVLAASDGYDVEIRTTTGAVMEMIGTDLYAEKIRYATSAYVADEANKGEGRIIRAWTTGMKRDTVMCTVNNKT